MNPPKKIFKIINEFSFHYYRTNPTDIEYHLAPVWLDAVKDPPKYDGTYLVTIQPPDSGRPFVLRDAFENGTFIYGVYVVGWMDLPDPYISESPKESEG